MNRRFWTKISASMLLGLSLGAGVSAQGADEAPDALVKRVSTDVLDSIKADKNLQSGDIAKVIALVETKVLPHVNFEGMTASAVGPQWQKATPAQQKRLQEEFKILLVRIYSGALTQVSDQTILVKPLRASVDDKKLLVRTEVRGKGDPIQIDYRLEKTPGQGSGWKIYDFNVLGVWMVLTYADQFKPQLSANGIDGLIAFLVERNKTNAKKG